jgi:DNA-directed RNA polymerase subunit E'/Rpb7
MQTIPCFTLGGYTETYNQITDGDNVRIKIVILLAVTRQVRSSGAVSNGTEKILLKKTVDGCGWYKQARLENATMAEQMHCANTIIFFANLLLKTTNDSKRFIQKTSHVKTRIENVRKGHKKLGYEMET